jgi:hypothetical protein
MEESKSRSIGTIPRLAIDLPLHTLKGACASVSYMVIQSGKRAKGGITNHRKRTAFLSITHKSAVTQGQ